MDRAFDGFFLALAKSEHATSFLASYWLFAFIGFAGFLFYWFRGVRIWFRWIRGAWGQKRGLFWLGSPQSAHLREFFSSLAKGFLVWLLGGWPIIMVATGMASESAVNKFLAPN